MSSIFTFSACASDTDSSLIRKLDSGIKKEHSIELASSFELIVKFNDSSVHSNLIMTPETKKIQQSSINYDLDELNVSTLENRDSGLDVLDSIYSKTGILLVHQRSLSLGYDLFVVKSNFSDFKEVKRELEKTGYFKSVKLNHVVKTNNQAIDVFAHSIDSDSSNVYPASFDVNMYSDPYFKSQVYLDEKTGKAYGNNNFLNASFYANENKKIDKVRIAVIDSGYIANEDVSYASDEADFVSSNNYSDCSVVDANAGNSDSTCLASNYIAKTRDMDATDKGWSFQKSNGSAVSDGSICIDGHGTQVASVIAAKRDNGVGLIGAMVDGDVEIVPVRALDCDGGSSSDVADAIVWSAGGQVPGMPDISEAVDVINLSLGSPGVDYCEEGSIYKDAVDFARSQGVVVVAAAGNESINVEDFAPANCDGVLTVGSNNQLGDISLFSNYGDKVDVTLTGENISASYLSTSVYLNPESDYCRDVSDLRTCYAKVTGTSFATPLASAMAGMLKLVKPELDESEIRSLIAQSADFDYETNVWGDEASRISKVAKAGITDAYKTLVADLDYSTIENIRVSNLYFGYTTDYEENYVRSLVSLADKDSVCNSYKVAWGNAVLDVDGISYVVYGSNSNSAMSESNSTALDTVKGQEAVVNLNGYTKLGIQAVYNGTRSDLIEVNLSQAGKPDVCAI